MPRGRIVRDQVPGSSSPPLLGSNLSVWLGGGVLLALMVAGYAGAALPSVAYELIVGGAIVAAWLASAAGIGGELLRIGGMRERLFQNERLLRRVVEIALGLGAVSILSLLLGLIGILNRFSAWAIIGIGVVALGARVARRSRPKGDAESIFARRAGWNWLWLAVVPALALVLVATTIPPGVLWGDEPNGYDVVEYHLQVPREWYELGRIAPLTHNVFSYFPFNVEMHYLLAMHLRAGAWSRMYLAQLMHASFIGLSIVAIAALTIPREEASTLVGAEADRAPLASSRRSLVSPALAAIAGPWLALLGPVAYNEGGLLLFGALAIGLSMRAIDDADVANRTRWMLLAGAMAGLACGSKLTGVPEILIAVPSIIAVVLLLSRRRVPFAPLIAYVLAGALTFSPWLIRNLVWTGNPVFPEATAVFGRAHFTEDQVQRWQRANHQPRPDQQNVPARLQALWQQVLGDARYGLVLIPLALVVAALRRDRSSAVLVGFLLFLAIFWTFFTHLQSRFFVLAIPIAALLVGRTPLRWMLPVTAVVVIGCGFSWWNVHRMWMEKDRAIRSPSAGQLRLTSLAGLESLKPLAPLQEQVPPDSMLVLVGDAKAFLYERPMSQLRYRTVFDVNVRDGQSTVDAWISDPPPPPGSAILIDPNELRRFSKTYWKIPLPPDDVAAHDAPYFIHR